MVISCFLIFTPIWGRFSFWLIFFKWIETTNSLVMILVQAFSPAGAQYRKRQSWQPQLQWFFWSKPFTKLYQEGTGKDKEMALSKMHLRVFIVYLHGETTWSNGSRMRTFDTKNHEQFSRMRCCSTSTPCGSLVTWGYLFFLLMPLNLIFFFAASAPSEFRES